jgi:hypothetical protein
MSFSNSNIHAELTTSILRLLTQIAYSKPV